MKVYHYIISRSRCITLALLICLLVSCASTKNTESDSNTDYTELLEGIRGSISILEKKIDTQSKTTSEKLSNLKVENKTVYLSPPDSTGKQHTTMESTTTATKVDEQRDETIQQTTELLSVINARIDSLARKIDLMSKTKVVDKKLTWWQQTEIYGFWVLLTLLVIGLAWKYRKAIMQFINKLI